MLFIPTCFPLFLLFLCVLCVLCGENAMFPVALPALVVDRELLAAGFLQQCYRDDHHHEGGAGEYPDRAAERRARSAQKRVPRFARRAFTALPVQRNPLCNLPSSIWLMVGGNLMDKASR